MLDDRDELFVGWAPAPPRDVARVLRCVVAALATLAVATPLVLVLAHDRLAPAAFEYGVARRFRGTMHATPVPVLVVARPDAGQRGVATNADGHPDEIPAVSTLLVAPGKHGASALAHAFDGRPVELTGTLAQRDGRELIEVEPASVRVVADDAAAAGTTPPALDLGPVRLAGEIVDSKCHLGVMNPGDGKTHRACAARCISGGIPPALRVRDASGASRLLLLVGPSGESIAREVLPYVAEPVEIAGRAERRGDLLVLYADPAAIRCLGEEG